MDSKKHMNRVSYEIIIFELLKTTFKANDILEATGAVVKIGSSQKPKLVSVDVD
jgi:hypothetical protein